MVNIMAMTLHDLISKGCVVGKELTDNDFESIMVRGVDGFNTITYISPLEYKRRIGGTSAPSIVDTTDTSGTTKRYYKIGQREVDEFRVSMDSTTLYVYLTLQ